MSRNTHKLSHIDFHHTHASTQPQGEAQATRGRSRALLQRRNQKIVIRYYFLNGVKNCTFAQTIALLEYEFDLDERTLGNILKQEAQTIIDLRKKKPSVASLKKIWNITW